MRTDVRNQATASSTSSEPSSHPHVILLVVNDATGTQLARLASAHELAHGDRLIIDEVNGPLPAAVEKARTLRGGCPIGVVTESDAEALEAIAAGADEAMRLPVIDLPSVLAFVDRTIVRASSRRQRERDQESVMHSEKLASLGAIIASVAHEINNPLTAVLLSLETLGNNIQHLTAVDNQVRTLAGLDPDELAEQVRVMVSTPRSGTWSAADEIVREAKTATESIADIVRDLLIFARGSPNESPRLIHVPELIDQVLRIVGHQLRGHAVIERDDAPDLPPILVPRTRLAMVLTNILVNASHAIQELESDCHRVRISTRSDGEAVAISISDTGPGIPPDVVSHIFDPFFTTKRESMGTGLGLSISRTTLRKLGGDLIVESVHGQGATFVAIVPLPERAAVLEAFQSSPAALVPRRSPSRVTVMLVDDDERVLKAYSRALHDRYDLFIAADGQEAIDLLRSGSTPSVIVTDMSMPSVDGAKLHEWVTNEHPELASRLIFVTAEVASAPRTVDERSTNLRLCKPVSRSALIEAIEATLTRCDTAGLA